MGQHIPWTPAPMEIPNGVEDFAQVDLARAPAAWVRFGRGKERGPQRPLLVRHLGWIYLSRLSFFQPNYALLW